MGIDWYFLSFLSLLKVSTKYFKCYPLSSTVLYLFVTWTAKTSPSSLNFFCITNTFHILLSATTFIYHNTFHISATPFLYLQHISCIRKTPHVSLKYILLHHNISSVTTISHVSPQYIQYHHNISSITNTYHLPQLPLI